MYSVVLMMALTGGSEAPNFGRHNGGCNGGCNGATVVAGCVGRDNGCHGSNGCNGCHGLFQRLRDRRNSHGCNGGCNGVAPVADCCCAPVVAAGCVGGTVAPPAAKEMPPPVKDEKKKVEPIPPPIKGVSLPSTLVVNLPADASLSVDGRLTTSTTGTRVFVTPALATSQQHFYTLTASVVRDGQTVSQTQRVAVTPGRQTQFSFTFPASDAAVSR